MLRTISYRFRFYPNADQRRQLAVEFGCNRFVWNTALDARGLAYRCFGRSENYVGLGRAITELKADPDYAWLKDATAATLTQTLIDQDKAFKNFFAGRAKYPKFKRKNSAQSVRYQLDQRQISKMFDAETKLFKLPKLGTLKLRWSRQVGGIPKMATVSLDASGRYFVSFSCEAEIRPLPIKATSVGVDLGLTSIATLSNGVKISPPRYIRKYARQLRKAQRVLSRRVKGSQRWQKARKQVAKIQARIADCRKDFLHKLTSRLVRDFGLIALEDLSVKGMMRALRLSKSVADASLGELVRQIEYKAQWHEREVVKIDRFARSTGVCPDCGLIGPRLKPGIDSWRCECGVSHDRDSAAAQVILQIATAGRAGIARGATYKPAVAA